MIRLLLLFPSLIFAQSRSGRGEDWWLYNDDYDYQGDGDLPYIFYEIFIIGLIVIGLYIAAVVVKLIYEAVKEEYEDGFKSTILALKGFGFILFIWACIFLIVYLIHIFDIKIPAFVENLWGFIASLIWIAIVRYAFFNHKTREELITSLKKPSGIFISILIILFIVLMTFPGI